MMGRRAARAGRDRDPERPTSIELHIESDFVDGLGQLDRSTIANTLARGLESALAAQQRPLPGGADQIASRELIGPLDMTLQRPVTATTVGASVGATIAGALGASGVRRR